MGRSVHPANARGGKAHLGKRAHHDDVLRFVDQSCADGAVLGGYVFGVSVVDHQQDFGPQASVQAAYFAVGQIGARRIVGIGQPDEPGGGGHGGQKSIDVGGVVILVDQHDGRAGGFGDDGIDRKAVAVHHRLVAFAQIGLG